MVGYCIAVGLLRGEVASDLMLYVVDHVETVGFDIVELAHASYIDILHTRGDLLVVLSCLDV